MVADADTGLTAASGEVVAGDGEDGGPIAPDVRLLSARVVEHLAVLASLPLPSGQLCVNAFRAGYSDARPGRGRFVPVSAIARACAAVGIDWHDPLPDRLVQLAASVGHACARNPATTRLRDGSTGWFVQAGRVDDCQRAAIATVLQVPIDDVPDPELDKHVDAGRYALRSRPRMRTTAR